MNNDLRKTNIWSFGKSEYKRFLDIKVSKKTSILSYLYGILLTAIPLLPIAWLMFEIVEVLWYRSNTVYIFLTIAWVLFMFANGLSNYISIRLLKIKEKDMDNMQTIDEKAIFVYQCFNIGFGVFVLFIFAFILVSMR